MEDDDLSVKVLDLIFGRLDETTRGAGVDARGPERGAASRRREPSAPVLLLQTIALLLILFAAPFILVALLEATR